LIFVSDLGIIVTKIQVVNVANDLAQMEVESFAAGVPVFSGQKRATKGSSFYGIEKKELQQELVTHSWNSS
jgi:hypothetical protein